ncbi:hypothetical protein [Simiduia aestuariiviva]|uniref:DUF1579 domain-containing protein n=1 Tax=Simiduia aestuariiviva TaxID=1510459 RepID=A0A839UPJ1_9GAMM|nr:hypothetical protein [Simiduia aestuariiviva]MBB3167347.1 hypothetical protein [Simiduia aestuariiviva]
MKRQLPVKNTISRLFKLGWFWGLLAPSAVLGAPCQSEAHRQFDFWLGQWEVRTADGNLAGHNNIQLVEQGCVLREQYRTPKGYTGQSYTLYDASRQQWHQTWVDNQGTLLLLSGGFSDGQMVLSGTTLAPEGEQDNRITWSQEPDGRVRQHWQVRKGEQWQSLFDGFYERVTPAAE